MTGDPEELSVIVKLEYCWEYDDPVNCIPHQDFLQLVQTATIYLNDFHYFVDLKD